MATSYYVHLYLSGTARYQGRHEGDGGGVLHSCPGQLRAMSRAHWRHHADNDCLLHGQVRYRMYIRDYI